MTDDDMAAVAAAYLLFGAGAKVTQAAGDAAVEHSAWTSAKLAGMR